MVNPRKAYPADPALIPVFDRSGRENLGHALETCVALELLRRGADVSYVRTAEGYEVDFLTRGIDEAEALIQVCAEPEEPATLERELRALDAAAAERRRATPHLITLRPETVRDAPRRVSVHSAAVWLLGQR